MRPDRSGVRMPGRAASSAGRQRNRPRTVARACTLAGSAAAVLLIAGCGRQAQAILIVNASVIDGTGAPARSAAVRIRGDRIIEVGELEPTAADSLVDAGGFTLAPGFIDTHSHADYGVIREGDSPVTVLVTDRRDVIRAVSQGITTGVIGQDGASPYPLSLLIDTLDAVGGIAINLASYTGHGSLRFEVMGRDYRRPATADEIARMANLLRADLDLGSLGLSTGLEYIPYVETDEVIALARVAAEAGGRYISHQRSEDRYFWSSLDEFLRIGREAGLPIQLSHAKLAMRGLWGQADSAIALLEAARSEGMDVTLDVYPYTYWHSNMTVLFPERDYTDRAVAAFNLRDVVAPEDFLIADYADYPPEPSYAGRPSPRSSSSWAAIQSTFISTSWRGARGWSGKPAGAVTES